MSSKISMKKIRPNIFSTNKKFRSKKIDQTFSDFFRRKTFRPEIFGLPIPIPNFPKIPKIALRKLCDAYHMNWPKKNSRRYTVEIAQSCPPLRAFPQLAFSPIFRILRHFPQLTVFHNFLFVFRNFPQLPFYFPQLAF